MELRPTTDVTTYLEDSIGLWVERLTDRRFEGLPGLFLDRDGVIVEEAHYLGRAEDVIMIESAASAIARVNRAKLPVVLVTNQAGIARGYYDWSGFRSVQDVIIAALTKAGGHFDVVLACGYHESGIGPLQVANHTWRKPNPGMLERAITLLGIDRARSLIVGDKLSDLQAGHGAGLGAGALTLTGHGASEADAVRAWCAAPEHSGHFKTAIVTSAVEAIEDWLTSLGTNVRDRVSMDAPPEH